MYTSIRNKLYDLWYGNVQAKPAEDTQDAKALHDEQIIAAVNRNRADQLVRMRDAIVTVRTNGNRCLLLWHGVWIAELAEVVNENGSGVLDVVLYGAYAKIIVSPYPKHES